MNHEITIAERQALTSLIRRGYCVVIFSPDELRGVDPDRITGGLVSDGFERIDQLAEEEN